MYGDASVTFYKKQAGAFSLELYVITAFFLPTIFISL